MSEIANHLVFTEVLKTLVQYLWTNSQSREHKKITKIFDGARHVDGEFFNETTTLFQKLSKRFCQSDVGRGKNICGTYGGKMKENLLDTSVILFLHSKLVSYKAKDPYQYGLFKQNVFKLHTELKEHKHIHSNATCWHQMFEWPEITPYGTYQLNRRMQLRTHDGHFKESFKLLVTNVLSEFTVVTDENVLAGNIYTKPWDVSSDDDMPDQPEPDVDMDGRPGVADSPSEADEDMDAHPDGGVGVPGVADSARDGSILEPFRDYVNNRNFPTTKCDGQETIFFHQRVPNILMKEFKVKRQIVMYNTGTGKTRTMVHLINSLLSNKTDTLILIPNAHIRTQFYKTLANWAGSLIRAAMGTYKRGAIPEEIFGEIDTNKTRNNHAIGADNFNATYWHFRNKNPGLARLVCLTYSEYHFLIRQHEGCTHSGKYETTDKNPVENSALSQLFSEKKSKGVGNLDGWAVLIDEGHHLFDTYERIDYRKEIKNVNITITLVSAA